MKFHGHARGLGQGQERLGSCACRRPRKDARRCYRTDEQPLVLSLARQLRSHAHVSSRALLRTCRRSSSVRVVSLAGAVAPRAEARARVGFGPGGLAVQWRSLVRVAGRRRTPPARRPRLARAGGPRARHHGQRACSLESSCPSLFVGLSRGETHDAVHGSFINLMKLPNVETLIFLVKPSHVLMSFL